MKFMRRLVAWVREWIWWHKPWTQADIYNAEILAQQWRIALGIDHDD